MDSMPGVTNWDSATGSVVNEKSYMVDKGLQIIVGKFNLEGHEGNISSTPH